MSDFQKNICSFNGFYRGKVLDNNDPLKRGRIKVEIYPMFKGLTADVLPWAVPAMPLFDGAADDAGYFAVPKVDSFVWCFFEAGEMHQPVFAFEAQTATKGIPSSAETNYPNRKVWKAASGVEIIYDDTAKTVIINAATEVDIVATTVNVTASNVNVIGGDVHVPNGDVTAKTISLINHVHINSGGIGDSGIPKA